ncbi:hypothetical protein [Streptomyces sp. NPDC053720]|uniref:hypothetical protein n=1 Tax=Streptomyces sp. NPDC053720 TaxID=3154855 RepID=UPI0034276B3E
MPLPVAPFVVAVRPEDLVALNAVVRKLRAAEVAWLDEAREAAGLRLLRGTAASAARGRIRTEFERLRAKGKLAGTRDLVIAREVRAELKFRKMNGACEPVPVEDARAPGRPVGTRSRSGSVLDPTDLTGRMAVRLPADLGEHLTRACYWKSAPAVKALREWQEIWGDGPEVLIRQAERAGALTVLSLMAAAMAPRPTADDLLEKARLQAMVVTTGDILRAAVDRALR